MSSFNCQDIAFVLTELFSNGEKKVELGTQIPGKEKKFLWVVDQLTVIKIKLFKYSIDFNTTKIIIKRSNY